MGQLERSKLKAFFDETVRPRKLLAQKDAQLAELGTHWTRVLAEKDAELAQTREQWSEALRLSQEALAQRDAQLAELGTHWTRVLADKDTELAQTREQWSEALRLSQEALARKDAHLAELADHWSKVLAEKDAELAQTREQWSEALRLSQEAVAQRDAQLAELAAHWTRVLAEKDAELAQAHEQWNEARRASQEAVGPTLATLDQVPTLIFLHIPKAAGTSFKFALQELLPPETLIYAVNGDPNIVVVRALMAMDPQQRAKLKAIMAHVPYGLHTLFPGARYVTLLREPVARILSTYYFLKSRTEFEFSKKIAAGMTIDEFAVDVFNDNAQVRRLMKYPDISRDDVFFHPPAGQLERAHLDDAKDTLRRCAVVGLAERYDEFLDCVSAEFGLPPIPRRDDNVTTISWHKEQLPERTIERLREINQLDLELYEYAKELAGEQAARQGKFVATRNMRPLYERASAREALEAQNKRLETENKRL
jgi:hypothetical protein